MSDSNELRFHDRQSQPGLAFFAVAMGLFGLLLLLSALTRHLSSSECFMIAFALVIVFYAWRIWVFARSPYLTLKSDHLLIQKFYRRQRADYADIAAVALEHKIVRAKYFANGFKTGPPLPLNTLYLGMKDGRLLNRILPFKVEPASLSALEERTKLKNTLLNGPEELNAWKSEHRFN